MTNYIAYNSKDVEIADGVLSSDDPIYVYPDLITLLNNLRNVKASILDYTVFAEVKTDKKDLFDRVEGEIYPCFACVKIVKTFSYDEVVQKIIENSKSNTVNYKALTYNSMFEETISNTADYGICVSTADCTVSSTSGMRAHNINCGCDSIAAATGINDNVTIYGSQSIAIVTGANSKATAKGIQSMAIARRSLSIAEATGKNSIAVAYNQAAARGKLGNFLIFINYDELGNIEEIRTQEVDGKTIKPDTCYRYNNGEFHEVEI